MSLPSLDLEPSSDMSNAALAVETDLSRIPTIETRDARALTEDQQSLLNGLKIEKRLKNEYYVREHPEFVAMIKGFLKKSLLERPDDIEKFAGVYFTDSDLKEKLKL